MYLYIRKRKRKTEVFFLGRQTINGNRRLLFQQTCPSLLMLQSLGGGGDIALPSPTCFTQYKTQVPLHLKFSSINCMVIGEISSYRRIDNGVLGQNNIPIIRLSGQ